VESFSCFIKFAFNIAKVELETHTIQVLLHANELPKRLSIGDKADNIADLGSFRVLARPNQISLSLLCDNFVLFSCLLLLTALLGLLSFLLFG
jgi:hypothetical protein